jgi:methyl-galactoside transport system substrate-binding protein
MKKLISILLVLVMLVCICAACSTAANGKPSIGCTIYKFDDTFMTSVRNTIAAEAKDASGNEIATVDIVDCQNSQPTCNDKIDMFITKKVSALAINMVDRTASGVIIDKAKAAKTPIVFFNREPLAEDMAKWDKVYYVGAHAEESGVMEGQMLIDYWKANPTMDTNKDGVMQYVLIKGEPGHQDSEARAKYSVETIEKAGIKTEQLAVDFANWDRVKGQEKMAAFLTSNSGKIEAVIACNDDMALGAIEALKAAGYFTADKFMPVVGVDATAPGLAAIKEGTLLGTAYNDGINQGKATFKLAYLLAKGEKPTKENVGYDIVDGKYVWVPYKGITKANMSEVPQ